MVYKTSEIERIAQVAIDTAKARDGSVCSVDKANVLETSVLWRKVVTEYFANHAPEIKLSHMYVDNAAMQLARDPNQFDVLFTENMFGDILSDLAAIITGSIGLAASGNINPEGDHPSMFEPVHGSAPDIVGKGLANPLAAILSAAMLLEHLGQAAAAAAIRKAVLSVVEQGAALPPDMGGTANTTQVGDAVVNALKPA